MKQFILVLLVGILVSISSCRTDFETVNSTGSLEFSKSKIYLDTVFNNIGSSTYRLKVYNRSNNDIKIPTIQLSKGTTSKYRLMVDGMTGEDADNNGIGDGKKFNNVEILAKDSLFIFIEITNNTTTTVPFEFTYDDQILFDTGANQQKVELTTLIWDAKFIFPNRPMPGNIKELLDINGNATDIIGHRLTDNDFFPVGSWQITNLKPTVIYGYALVPTGKTLTITEGASLYFHADTYSGLIVENGGTLIINGDKNDVNPTTNAIITKREVTFEADRLEPNFEDTPGQWGGVYIISSAAATATNTIKNLTLKNSTFGIYTQNIDNAGIVPNLDIQNTKIFNSSAFGMLNRNTNVVGKNLVINYSGQANTACLGGGVYNFTHCTFNNNWSSSKQRAVYVNNYKEVAPNNFQIQNVSSLFKNCIIYGSFNAVALEIDYKSPYTPTDIPKFDRCLIKFNDANTIFANNSIYNSIRSGNIANTGGNIVNLDPKFKNINKNQLNILTNSAANNLGIFDNLVNKDIDKVDRTTGNTDLGAYQMVP